MSDRPWKYRRRAGIVAVLVGGALTLAGCGASAAGPGAAVGTAVATPAAGGGLHFAVITHGTAGDAFWNVVKNGAQAAGQKLGVAVDYQSDGDPGAQAKLIDNEVAQHVNGLVVSMANPDALQTSIRNAVQAGIPVITINSGEDRSAEFGALTHVGQNEGIAGEQAGSRFKQAGRTKLLCVIHEAGNIGLNQRCDGAKRTFGNVTTVQVDINNPTDAQARIRGALQSDPQIDAVLALNSQVAAGAVAAVQAAGSKAQVATFDLNSDVVNAIKAGDIVFAVDQQPYLQGYLPIVFLQLYKENADTVGGGRPVLTGPAFVDKSNVDAVASYATPRNAVIDGAAPARRLADRLISRPEVGAALGALGVFVFFSAVTEHFLSRLGAANWLDDASTLGIAAVAVALLMIGGEFDLSAGVMTASTALVTAILATREGMNVWLALGVSLLFALAVGAFNGLLVVRTGLPSFIVTLGTFLALQGLNLGVTRRLTGTVQVSGMRATVGYRSAARVFASTVEVGGTAFQVSILWWAAVTAVAAWVLVRTRFGNWVFAVGGSAPSARAVGVPVARTKVALFATTAFAGWLVGSITLLRNASVQANQGIGLEFQYIVAAVIGGCLLTGGFGSALGAAIGALIFGMARQGIVYAQWDSDWFQLFLGVMLLAAVAVNNAFRRRAERVGR